jgi:hypothetical protein
MSAKSNALRFLAVLAVLPAMLALTVLPAGAVIDKEESDACASDLARCKSDCSINAREFGKVGSRDFDSCYSDCRKICDYKKSDCLDDADKDAPKAPKTKVQPKVKPGGAETPGTENPKPKGGIQQQP